MNAVILSAGKGTRMQSEHPKVIHDILGKPMVNHVTDNIRSAGITNITAVVGYGKDQVIKVLDEDVKTVEQKEQLGTGHAVLQAKEILKDEDGVTLILAGDQPLISTQSIKNLIKYHKEYGMNLTLLTSILEDPTGYGRIVKDGNQVIKITEDKDCNDQEREINEVNISTYCINNYDLWKYIEKINNDNAQKEYYITDLIEIFIRENLRVGSITTIRSDESIGINDRKALSKATQLLSNRINEKLMVDGVTIINPQNTMIGPDVEIDVDTIIYPGAYIAGNTKIGKSVSIEGASFIIDSQIDDYAVIRNSRVTDSKVGANTSIGPYAHLRQNAIVGDDNRIGNFVELKNTITGTKTNAAHLTYLGDAELGKNINIGCGVVTVNYDGHNKNKTIIHDNSFVGSQVAIIAPVEIGKDTLVAAGSTIVDDIPDGALAIERGTTSIKENRAKKIFEKVKNRGK